ncbi:MAG: FAD:protein FMN transferase [Vicinamibacterales bacterium]
MLNDSTRGGGVLDVGRPGGPGGVRRFSREAMASVFEVYARHADEGYAAQAAHSAFDVVEGLERQLSRFVSNSDIARVNRLAPGESTLVSAFTMECLVVARHVFDLTGGAFDVSLGTGLPALELDREAFVVHATKGGVNLDLGGIGKGYAVDLMAESLEEWDVTAALVHGGFSSVVALEPPTGSDGWQLALSCPAAPSGALARLSVRQVAIGASGVGKGSHIVDPRSGEAAHGRLAAWALVPRPTSGSRMAASVEQPRLAPGAIADALATAFMVLTTAEIETLCERNPGLEGWLLEVPAPGSNAAPELLHFGRDSQRPGA